ncbi:MAG: 2-hydroxy-6-oxohepta-2,4-dienoate hydrolase [Prochlorococcus sp. SP3034]|nr:2-hydroxy-6-oxohepta-2,4-dienoate hydrolase [Prochlorococcus sp. SP3034]|tara:strand:- start:6379 stop:7269 length:891 start_codon:yes stop_codon:yes gene_type:complete
MSNDLNNKNLSYFLEAKCSLLDPLAKDISEEVKWVEIETKWGHLDFPIVQCGEGDPVLFLHGFDSCFLEFRRILPFLKTNFKIIIPDLFGFGFSPRIEGINYTTQNIINNLIDILNKLNIEKNLKIVGASMGGSVSLHLSEEIPNNIEKMILLSPAGLFEEPKSIPFPFNQIGAVFLGTPFVRRNLCRQAFAFPDKSVGLKEEQIASIHLGCKGWRNSLASFAKNGGFGGSIKYLNLIDIPTKIVCGENDRILGKLELDKIGNLKNINSINLKNCGHLPHLDLPNITAKIIKDFLN